RSVTGFTCSVPFLSDRHYDILLVSGLSSIRSLVIAKTLVLYAFVKKSTASTHVAAYLNAALLPTVASVQAVSVAEVGKGTEVSKHSLSSLLTVSLRPLLEQDMELIAMTAIAMYVNLIIFI